MLNQISPEQLSLFSDNIVVYGASDFSDFLRYRLGIKPVCYCDDKLSAQKNVIDGIEVLSLQDITSRYDDDLPIFIALLSKNSVEKVNDRLLKCGFRNIFCADSALEELYADNFYRGLFSDEHMVGMLPKNRMKHYIAERYDVGRMNDFHFLKFLDENPKYQDENFVVIPQLVHLITTRCVLNCKYCGQLMPYFKSSSKNQNFSLNEIVSDIDRVLESADEIGTYVPEGGEVFLYEGLVPIFEKLINSKKVKAIRTTTTGTLIPEDNVLDILQNEKIIVDISNYGNMSARIDKLREIFEQKRIRYTICKDVNDDYWIDYGVPYKRERSAIDNAALFSNCRHLLCNCMIGGKFYACSRNSQGSALGLIPENSDDYVDFRVSDTKTIRNALKKFYVKKCILACDYCEGSSALHIPVAEQCSADYNPWEELSKKVSCEI